MSTPRRYMRQMLLAEIGEEGQRRIGEATAAVAGAGLTHDVATAYATRAGIGRVVPGVIDESRSAPAFLEYEAPRAVVAGARAALAAIRDAVFASERSGETR